MKNRGRSNSIKGFSYIWQSFSFIEEHPSLRKFLILPALISLVIIILVFYLGYTYLLPLVDAVPRPDDGILRWLTAVARPLMAVIMIFVIVLASVLLYTVLGNVLAAPFNAVLSEKVESLLLSEERDETILFSGAAGQILKALGSVIRMLLMLSVAVSMLATLNIIPIAGTILHLVLSLLYTLFLMGRQFLDPVLERKGVGPVQRLKISWKYKFPVIGLGLGFFLLAFIPLADFLGQSYGTIAATRFYVEVIRPEIE